MRQKSASWVGAADRGSAGAQGLVMDERPIEVPRQADGNPCEGRAAPRYTLLIRAAKLISPQGEFICVIRDVSETGISLRGFHELPSQEPFTLELQTGEHLALQPVWARGNEAGFRFPAPIDVGRLVAEVGQFPKRKIRLGIPFPAELVVLGQKVPAQIVNLSQQGAKVRSIARLALAQPLRVVSRFMPEVRARVRWRRDAAEGAEYGLVFDDTFSLSQIALFAAAVQAPQLAGIPAQAALRS